MPLHGACYHAMERADAIGFNHAQIADDPANGNALANNEFACNATPPVSYPRKPVLPSASMRHLCLPSSAIDRSFKNGLAFVGNFIN